MLTNQVGDRFLFDTSPQGVAITVFPSEPPFDSEVFDVFTLGLAFHNAARFLTVIDSGDVFKTEESNVEVERVGDALVFSFASNHDHMGRFQSTLESGPAQELLRSVRQAIHGTHAPTRETSSNPQVHVGRNDPCPCGSGKKHKKCCIRTGGLNAGSDHQGLNLVNEVTKAAGDPYVRELADSARAFPDATSDAGFWLELGGALGSSGEHTGAERAFRESLAISPEWSPALINLAVTMGELGDRERGLAILERADPQTQRYAVVRANLLQSLGRNDEAIPFYESAILEEPTFDLPYIRLVHALRETGSPLVEHWLTRGIKALPRSPSLASEWCRFLFMQGRLEELTDAHWIDDLEAEAGDASMIGRRADDPARLIESRLWRQCGVLARYPNSENLASAAQLLKSFAPIQTTCDPARIVLGAAAQLGSESVAELAYEMLCKDCRDNTNEIAGDLNYHKAVAGAGAGRWDDAIKYCESVLRDDSDHAPTLHLHWWCLDELGRFDEAVSSAKRYLDLKPEDEHINYNLGRLCGLMGDHGKAGFYYRQQCERTDVIHLAAMENLVVTLTLQGKVDDASRALDHWARAAEEVDTGFGEDGHVVQAKLRSAEQMFDFARACEGSPTYLLQVAEFSEKLDPPLGSHLAIRPDVVTAEEALNQIWAEDHAQRAELQFRLARSIEGDLSGIVLGLRTEICSWQALPDHARTAFIGSERRLREGGKHDHAPEVVGYAKAVEIALKELVFDRFKEFCSSELDVTRQVEIGLRDEFRQAHRFVRYVEKVPFIELGGMVHTLRLASGKTGERLPLLSEFQRFVREELCFSGVLEPAFIDRCDSLARSRNQAAHATSCDREDAENVRASAVELLSVFGTGPRIAA